MTAEPLLTIEDLVIEYGRGRRRMRAVDGASLTIGRGQTLGLVGESGSGKTSIGRAVLGLTPITSGRVLFDGEDLTAMPTSQRRRLGSRLQVVFQDPYGSLNPTRTIGYTLMEPLLRYGDMSRDEADERVVAMLGKVGLHPDARQRYPAQFSGGQRQRIAIARALVLAPALVVCDEPVSALDLSIQAEVINLMMDLKADLGVSFLFVSHDLTVVRHISDHVAVLERGRVVEQGGAEQLYHDPQHPYTRALLAAAPIPDPGVQRERRVLRRAAREGARGR